MCKQIKMIKNDTENMSEIREPNGDWVKKEGKLLIGNLISTIWNEDKIRVFASVGHLLLSLMGYVLKAKSHDKHFMFYVLRH